MAAAVLVSTLVTRSIQTETGNSNMNMNIRTSIPLLASLLALNMPAVAAEPTTTLQYDRPARSFHQSLPLGNGRIGAMVFGGVAEDRIVLNESSVWSGSREDANRPDAHRALPEIRRLLLAGKNAEAERLVNANFTCQYQGSGRGSGANVPFGCYQTLGNLRLTFGNSRQRTHAAVRERPSRVVGRSGDRVLDGWQPGIEMVHHPRRATRGLATRRWLKMARPPRSTA